MSQAGDNSDRFLGELLNKPKHETLCTNRTCIRDKDLVLEGVWVQCGNVWSS